MKHDEIRLLAEKYWAGQCTPEEAEKVLNWLLKDEGRAFYERRAQQRIAQLNAPQTGNFDSHEAGAERLFQRAKATELKNSRPLLYKKWAAAASITIILILSGLIWFAMLSGAGMEEVKTTYGQTKIISLPDGSTVMLNANSSLSYANAWEKQEAREVWLEGEGFFSVVHTETDQKFTVHSGEMFIQVLGTEFNVSNWNSEPAIVLTSGKVSLSKNNSAETIEMKPGERAIFSNTQQTFEIKEVDTKLHTSWKNEQWIFQRMPLSEVFLLLEHTQGLSIKSENIAVDSLLFTATLPANRPDIALKAIARTFKLKISQKDQTIMIQTK